MQQQWEKFDNDFDSQRSVLFLGPMLTESDISGDETSQHRQLCAHIVQYLDQYQIHFDKASQFQLDYITQLFLKISGTRRVDLEDIIVEFYQKQQSVIPETLRLIADLPVKYFINTAPDNALVNALRKSGKQPLVHYYNFRLTHESKRNPKAMTIDLDRVTVDRPLVYHLFGILDDPESLVLTSDDQLDFVRNIVRSNPPVPDEILSILDMRKTFLFLGFDMENWQLRLLLDNINLGIKSTALSTMMADRRWSTPTTTFYKERFNFRFIEKSSSRFLEELHQKINAGTSAKTKKICILFSDADIQYLKKFSDQLKPLEQNDALAVWHKELVTYGNIEDIFIENLKDSDIVLFLVSPDFLADETLFSRQIAHVFRHEKERDISIFPVILRPCDWRSHNDLNRFYVLPVDGTPVSSNHWESIDDAIFQTIWQLKKLIR